MKKSTTIALLFIIIVAVLALWLTFSLFKFDGENRNADLGQFGDFYGGVLGTIITVAGLFFIYKTYSSQSEQLIIAKYDADFEIINKLYNDLLADIDSIQYRKAKNEINQSLMHSELYQGIDALYNFDAAHWNNPNSVINHLNSIALSFEQLLEMVKRVKYKYQDMKDIMLSKTYFLFYSKIIWPAYSIYENRDKYELEHNPDATLFFNAYEKLSKESIIYLVDKKRISEPTNSKIIKLMGKN